MLSVSSPVVTEVAVASDSWIQSFRDHLESTGVGSTNHRRDGSEVISTGYRVPTGSSDQLTPLSWDGLNQIRIRFSEFVDIDAADLSLSGVAQDYYEFSGFDYYPEVNLAVWTTATPLPIDRFRLDLDADGLDPVIGASGVALDGDWTDSVSSVSGDGVAGGDFEFEFKVLHGDALGYDWLDWTNVLTIHGAVGADPSHPAYFSSADINGNGVIDNHDWQVPYGNMFAQTPAGIPAGVTNDAPTTSGVAVTEITNDAIDIALSMHDAFDDFEDADSALTYAIEDVSDPLMFDAVSIDQQAGTLVVNAASSAQGIASVTVSATDSDGSKVRTRARFRVDQPAFAPSITMTTTYGGSGSWLIEGWVSDPDSTAEQLDDMLLLLSGFEYAVVSVSENGYFAHVVLVPPQYGGTIWAEVVDDEGNWAPQVFVEVGF